MGFKLRFCSASKGTDQEIAALSGMGLLKRMLDHRHFNRALQEGNLPQPGRHRLGTVTAPSKGWVFPWGCAPDAQALPIERLTVLTGGSVDSPAKPRAGARF